MFSYIVDENNVVWGYAPEQEEPCLMQPHYPNGEPWKDREDAIAWAESWILHITDPENNEFIVAEPE
jgi:hypothetical protein